MKNKLGYTSALGAGLASATDGFVFKVPQVAASFEHVANDETHTFCSFISAHSNPDVERTGELS